MAKDTGAGRRRVAAKHGLSHHERDLLTEGLDLMRQRGRAALFISVEAGREPGAESVVRAVTRRVRSDLARRQRRAGMRRQYALTVFEALGRDRLPKFGGHIVALMPTAPARDRLIETLNGRTYGGHVLAKPVTDWAGLTTYLLKESTPQAAFRKGFRRVGGSIRLGVRGGDRVRLSEDLRGALVRSGRIDPYRTTYAKRLPGAPAFGISRPQATNVIVGRFGVSRPIARRVLELSSAEAA